MDKNDLNEYLEKHERVENPIDSVISSVVGKDVDSLCSKLNRLPKDNKYTDMINHVVLLSILSSTARNTDEMIGILKKTIEIVISIDTDFNKNG